MRNLKRISLVSLVSVALLGTMALPANAVPLTEGDTTVTVVIPAGEITISVPAEGSPLNAQAPSVNLAGEVEARTAIATIGNIQVNNLRGDASGWVSTVTISDLQLLDDLDTPVPGKTISNAAVTFASTEISTDGADLAIAAGEVTATPTTQANNTGTFSTTVTVAIPKEALAGKYSGTLTHSLL